jgi:hypothetical protein
MARCPFARWMPLPWNAGRYVAGPFKIVRHTTEGSTAAGAFATYHQTQDIPHFTVDDQFIYQHLDTEVAATRVARRSSRGPYTLTGPRSVGRTWIRPCMSPHCRIALLFAVVRGARLIPVLPIAA